MSHHYFLIIIFLKIVDFKKCKCKKKEAKIVFLTELYL